MLLDGFAGWCRRATGNALHLIFPMGERFFVRAVRHYMSEIEDLSLREQIRGFFGQEGRYAHEHEREHGRN